MAFPGSTVEDVAVPHTGVTRIAPSQGWVSLELGELWRYRELLVFLAVRDIKVRYKQTVLGVAWAVLQPVATALIFALVFGRLAKLPSGGLPYVVFALAGLVVWSFFSAAFDGAANSLVSNGSLVSKVYFPRLCVPIAAVVASFIDFLIGLVVLVPVMAGYQVWGGLRILLLPIFIVLAFAAALGFALWLAPVAVKYRDVRHVIPFMLQAWLFLTPVAYSTTLLDSGWRWVYALNPMVGIVEGFRWSLLGIDVAITGPALISAGIALTVLVGGALYFRRKERTLADVL